MLDDAYGDRYALSTSAIMEKSPWLLEIEFPTQAFRLVPSTENQCQHPAF